MNESLKSLLATLPRSRRIAWTCGHLCHHIIPNLLPIRTQLSGKSVTNPSQSDVPIQSPSPSLPKNLHGYGRQPILVASDVDDYGTVDFVADPFLWPSEDGTWHLIFEVFNQRRNPTGVIAHAYSRDLLDWEYDKVILETGVHTSFPYVFKHEDQTYLLPAKETTSVDLYRAVEFPYKWKKDLTLVDLPHNNDDAIVFRWKDRWWLFVANSSINGINVYHTENLLSTEWVPHKDNPVVKDRPAAGRPGGRPIIQDNKLFIFYQDCYKKYGDKLRCFEITDLNRSSYTDVEVSSSPVLQASDRSLGWNSGRMHHMDPWWTGKEWVCAVDGNVAGRDVFTEYQWSIGIYVSRRN